MQRVMQRVKLIGISVWVPGRHQRGDEESQWDQGKAELETGLCFII